MKKFLCSILIVVITISCFGCASTTTIKEVDAETTLGTPTEPSIEEVITEEPTTDLTSTAASEEETQPNNLDTINAMIDEALAKGLDFEKINAIESLYNSLSYSEQQNVSRYNEFTNEVAKFKVNDFTNKVCNYVDNNEIKCFYTIDEFDDTINVCVDTDSYGATAQYGESGYMMAQVPAVIISFDEENGTPCIYIVWIWNYASSSFLDVYVTDQELVLLSDNSSRIRLDLYNSEQKFEQPYTTRFLITISTQDAATELLNVIQSGTITAQIDGLNSENIKPTVVLGNDCISNIKNVIQFYNDICNIAAEYK